MKSTDERMIEVLGRARAREVAARRKRQRAVAIGGGALSVVAVVVVALGFSSGTGVDAPYAGDSLGLMGSVLAGGSTLGYVVAGLLGLVLGVVVTVLAYRVGRARDELAPCAEDGISVHTSGESADSPAKAQVGKIASELVRTNSESRPASDCSADEGVFRSDEGDET